MTGIITLLAILPIRAHLKINEVRGDVVIFLWNFFLIATQVELFSSQHIHYEKNSK